jgi:hypothetical protein
MKIVSDVTIAFFSIFIVLGVTKIVSVVMMTCFYKYWCRYLVYSIFVIFFVFGLVCFLLAIGMSIITPAIYFVCDFVEVSISSSNNFSTNL